MSYYYILSLLIRTINTTFRLLSCSIIDILKGEICIFGVVNKSILSNKLIGSPTCKSHANTLFYRFLRPY
jgi:hypothetical protein